MFSMIDVLKCNRCDYCFDGTNTYSCPECGSNDISDEELSEEEIEEVCERWWKD